MGLLLVSARYYDPQVGWFISRDTELDQQPYAYCDGDPVNKLDPSGHWVLNITGPCVSIGLGFIHLDINVGISVQGPGLGAKNWGFEGYGSGGFGFGGIGFRASPYIGGPGFGRGNLNDFDHAEVASNATLSFQ